MGSQTLALLNSTTGAFVILGALAILVWFVAPWPATALPRPLILFLTVFTFSSIVPGSIGLYLQIVGLVIGYIMWLLTPKDERRAGIVVLACGLVTAYWALLIFHPNIPSFDVGMLGFRKTVLALGGIVLGCAIKPALVPKVEVLVVRLVALAAAISLVGYFFIPEIAELVPRAADKYTALYRGEERLQGLFSGPFHVAAAGILLIGWALIRRKQHPRTALLALAIGVLATYFTYVRSAYVAIALVLAVAVFASASGAVRTKRLYLLAVGCVSAFAVMTYSSGNLTTTVDSISGYSTDGRFQNRIPEWLEGRDLVLSSPFYGWGSGSAGDTLGSFFGISAQHVTPHNLLLKFAVEGGLIGLGLVLFLAVAVLRRLTLKDAQGQVAVVSAVGLLAMGITGSVIDTLPISYLALLLVGLGVATRATEKARAPEQIRVPSQVS
ncbi:O-antigen ligase family protein [Rhodococcus sp. NPDC019627]|uniref:O-antigen ligase family protein n=1 Tax=unclassified Rhodococcus (in: high G+C Gram-positive bacteria) TaxID=192944 RepID=UPI00340A4803